MRSLNLIRRTGPVSLAEFIVRHYVDVMTVLLVAVVALGCFGHMLPTPLVIVCGLLIALAAGIVIHIEDQSHPRPMSFDEVEAFADDFHLSDVAHQDDPVPMTDVQARQRLLQRLRMVAGNDDAEVQA
jgi:hypothetical protein